MHPARNVVELSKPYIYINQKQVSLIFHIGNACLTMRVMKGSFSFFHTSVLIVPARV